MNCPICDKPIVQPWGKGNILIIGEAPTQEDLQAGRPFTGDYTHALRLEMAKAGYDLYQCRLTTLWLHEPVKEGKGKKATHQESEWHFAQALHEAIGYNSVLLLGTEVTEFFLGYNSTEISGIPMTSPLLSAQLIMGTRSPLDVMGGTIGEFRLGIVKFIKAYKELMKKEMVNE